MGFKDSVLGALGIKAPTVSKAVLQKIRDAMLDELGKLDSTTYKSLFMKLYYADDIEKLWHSRTDLLPALKEMHGDSGGNARMESISELFVGHHPAAKKNKSLRSYGG